jgi:hypothetical protein
MQQARSTFLLHPLWLFAILVVGFSPPTRSATVEVKTVLTPTEGGTVRGGGFVEAGSRPRITINAAANWFINQLRVVNTSDGLVEIEMGASDFPFGLGTESYELNGPLGRQLVANSDKEVWIEFATKAPKINRIEVVQEGVTNRGPIVLIERHHRFDIVAHFTGIAFFGTTWILNGEEYMMPPNCSDPAANGCPEGELYSARLRFGNPGFEQRGKYSIQVKNNFGSETSEEIEIIVPAEVTAFIKSGNGGEPHLINESNVVFAHDLSIVIGTDFSNPVIFYTLDGTTPSFESPAYGGLIEITNTARLRAIAYRADLLESASLAEILFTRTDPVELDLESLLPHGSWGQPSKEPPFAKGETIEVRPYSFREGAQFMSWVGALISTQEVVSVALDSETILHPIFGNIVFLTVQGSGTVEGLKTGTNLVPVDAVLELQAIPNLGNYFVQWGGAVNGTDPRLVLTNTGPPRTNITALFLPLPTNRFSFSVATEGVGYVTVNESGNSFAAKTSVSVTAIPGPNQQFIGWSGAATGSENPLTLSLISNVFLVARFSTNLTISSVAVITPSTFPSLRILEFDVSGGLNGFRIEESENLSQWRSIYRMPAFPGQARISLPYRDEDRTKLFRAVQP